MIHQIVLKEEKKGEALGSFVAPLSPKLQTSLARVLDELERNQKKENHLNTISKIMGTLVHVQLYTFSYRKPVIRPQNMPKTADWG